MNLLSPSNSNVQATDNPPTPARARSTTIEYSPSFEQYFTEGECTSFLCGLVQTKNVQQMLERPCTLMMNKKT